MLLLLKKELLLLIWYILRAPVLRIGNGRGKAVTVQGFRGSGLNENPPAIRRAGVNLEPMNAYE